MKKLLIIFFWLLSIASAVLYTYENPEQLDKVKKYLKDEENLVLGDSGEILRTPGNSFMIEFSKVVSFSEKTAFIIHDEKSSNFEKNNLKIYFQNGDLFKNSNLEKTNLSKNFTTIRNGGIKTVFTYKNKFFVLASSLFNECYYASITSLDNANEVFKTRCLPKKNIDFNGLGSSHIHTKDAILLSIGTPEQESSEIRKLAQDKNSMFGKIISINKKSLDEVIEGSKTNLEVKIFTLGHRNPQGFTKINESYFSVEHGPKGGDELNRIIKDRNYGWPKVSYGTQYVYDEKGKSYEINHEKNQFEEPLFAFVPSVGISALNQCPTILKKYYKKPCLLALSLYGNSLRRGRSIIIYLLNEEKNKVHSIERIHLRDDLKLRHFVTNSKNEIYEDKEGNIFIAADKKGIYKLSFKHFRN